MWHKNFLKFSSITLVIVGLILLFGPKYWFPDYYKPVFMGIVAVISPFLISVPEFIFKKDTPQKRKLVLEMRSAIAFSLSVNIGGELGLFQLYKFGFQYDKFAHFVVSMLFAFILGEALKEWHHFPSRKVVWLVFLIIFSSGVLWEIFEATSDFLFRTQEWGVYGNNITWDTYEDISFNILGALAGIIVFMIPKGHREKPNKTSPPKRNCSSF